MVARGALHFAAASAAVISLLMLPSATVEGQSTFSYVSGPAGTGPTGTGPTEATTKQPEVILDICNGTAAPDVDLDWTWEFPADGSVSRVTVRAPNYPDGYNSFRPLKCALAIKSPYRGTMVRLLSNSIDLPERKPNGNCRDSITARKLDTSPDNNIKACAQETFPVVESLRKTIKLTFRTRTRPADDDLMGFTATLDVLQ